MSAIMSGMPCPRVRSISGMGTRRTNTPLSGERTVPGGPAENYWFRRHEAAYRWAAGRTSGRVLDAGAGEGYGAAILAGAAGGAVVAAELEAAAAAHAAARYPSVHVLRA